METGVVIRNMGTQSTRETMAGCARAIEEMGFDSVWVVDHIAIPPDDAEGSGGRYMDVLSSLAWLAGITERVKLGSGVLILPYRAALPTAKQIATIQELSGNRLLMGMGIGWMDPEFKALGLNRHTRGRVSDETLAFLNDCFASDEVEANGQKFLFKPRPPKPPFLIGGRAPHAIERAAKFGDGWYPLAKTPSDIADHLPRYRALTDAAGKPPGFINISARLPLDDMAESRDLVAGYREAGVDRMVCGVAYETVDDFRAGLDKLRDVTG
ncbi:MAG: hypothetical protein CMM59_13955 [Rhodospirillaceae bacterium]|nr:hypothetical protein [Rhodospirillaceae bacterium]